MPSNAAPGRREVVTDPRDAHARLAYKTLGMCRHCTECPDSSHHWMEGFDEDDDGDPLDPDAPRWTCKHCDFSMPWGGLDPESQYQELVIRVADGVAAGDASTQARIVIALEALLPTASVAGGAGETPHQFLTKLIENIRGGARAEDQLLRRLRDLYNEQALKYRDGFRHKEAWCLMKYEDAVTGESEIVWNSRNGVTPFIILSRAGNEAEHSDWSSDRLVPEHKPQVGDRVFADVTPERALELAEQQVAKLWDSRSDFRDAFDSKGDAIEHFAVATYGSGIPPDLVEVTEEMAQERGWVTVH